MLQTLIILACLWPGSNAAIAAAADDSAAVVASLFADDDAVLADNVVALMRRTETLPADKRFEVLADWVLPSAHRSEYRMNAVFPHVDPIPGLAQLSPNAIAGGIYSPVFALIAVAEESGRLDELRQRVEAVRDANEPNRKRSRLALLFMIAVAQKDSESAAKLLGLLTELVRVRGENHGVRWWPETLALAYGMEHSVDALELKDFAACIFDRQVDQARWSGCTAWDNYVFQCFARVSRRDDIGAKEQDLKQRTFQGWIPADVMTAESRGCGWPPATWRASGNTMQRLGGHSNDFLYLPIPLTGNFDLQCEVTAFNYHEMALAYAGVYAAHQWLLSKAEVGGLLNQELVTLDPPMTYPNEWLSAHIVVRDGVCTHYVNGRKYLQRALHGDSFPWLALRSRRQRHGSFRNLTVTGDPQIPRSVNMINDSELTGWWSYFDSPEAAPIHSAILDRSSWMIHAGTADEPELISRKKPELAGTQAENLLLHHRPMVENGVIEYEFYYVPDEFMVHPALDRRVMLLAPEGVQTHFVTDGAFQFEPESPVNVIRHNKIGGSTPIPLKANDWNQCRVSIQNDGVYLSVNGTEIFQFQLDESNHRQFGLFHFADQTEARVRNMIWTGDWPKTLDEVMQPLLLQNSTFELEKSVAALPKSFHHDFRNSELPEHAFSKSNSSMMASKEGVVIDLQSNGSWMQSDLQTQLQVGGDFDLRASFRDLSFSESGAAGIQLMATLEGTRQEIRVARTSQPNKRQEIKQEVVNLDPDGNRQATAHWKACEATEGTLRLVRLGKTLHYLVAENDSSVFRLFGTDDVGDQDLRVGDLCVSAFAADQAHCRTVWTTLSVRAERLSGMALLNQQAEVDRLNEQREQFAVFVVHDFTKTAPDPKNFSLPGNAREWKAADKGWTIESEGVDGWVAAFLGSRDPIQGDFDVTLTFDAASLALPSTGRTSTLMWQVQLRDGDRSRFASMFMRTPTEYKVSSQQHRTLPTGKDEYSWNGGFEIDQVASLRIARHGKTYTMLARPKDSDRDRVIYQKDHSAGPIVLHCLLHTGATKQHSSVLLKSIQIHAESYMPAGENNGNSVEEN